MSGFLLFVSLTKWECLWRFSQNQKQLYQVTYNIAWYNVILQYTICDERVIIFHNPGTFRGKKANESKAEWKLTHVHQKLACVYADQEKKFRGHGFFCLNLISFSLKYDVVIRRFAWPLNQWPTCCGVIICDLILFVCMN